MKISKGSSIRYVEAFVLGAGIGMQEDSSGRIELFSSGTGGGGVSVLNDLTDVIISSPATAHYLRYNGSEWANSAFLVGDLPSHTHPASQVTAGTFAAGVFTFPSGVNVTDYLLASSVIAGTEPGNPGVLRVGGGGVRIENNRGIVWNDNAAQTTHQGYILYSSSNNINFGTDNTTRWQIRDNGTIVPFVPTVYSIGSGALRPKDVYVGSKVYIGENRAPYAGSAQETDVFGLSIIHNLSGGTAPSMYAFGAQVSIVDTARDITVDRHISALQLLTKASPVSGSFHQAWGQHVVSEYAGRSGTSIDHLIGSYNHVGVRSGTATWASALEVDAYKLSSGTITNLIGAAIFFHPSHTPTSSANAMATNQYGVRVGPIVSGTTNYAWYSEEGLSFFKDSVRIGTQPATNNTGLYVVPDTSVGYTGTNQQAISSRMVGTPAGVGAIIGIGTSVATSDASYTANVVAGVRIFNATKGVGSTITSQYGLLVENQDKGTTNRAIKTNLGEVEFGDDLILGTVGTFQSTPTGTLRTDDVWSYNGSVWTNRLLQVSFGSGDVVAQVQADNTRTSYVNTVATPLGTPTAPTSGQDIVLTPIYKGMIVDVTAYGALPANMQFVAEYSINSGSSFTALPAFTGNKIVHSNLNLPWGYRYRYKVRGATDSTYSDETADTLPSAVAETNAFGIIVASQISTASLSAITADIGEVITGKLRNSANDRGILLGGSLPGSWTTYLNLDASGSNAILYHPGIRLNADGSAVFSGTVNIMQGNALLTSLYAVGAAFDFGSIDNLMVGTLGGPASAFELQYNTPLRLGVLPDSSRLTGMTIGSGYAFSFRRGTGSETAHLKFTSNQIRAWTGTNSPHSDVPITAAGLGVWENNLCAGNNLLVSGTTQYTTLGLGNIGGSKVIDWRTASIQKVVLFSGTTNLIFQDPIIASGRASVLTLYAKQDNTGNRGIVWPGVIKWPNNTAPTLTTTANRTDIFTFLIDSGVGCYFGATMGKDYII